MDSTVGETLLAAYDASKDTCRGISFERFVYLLQDFDFIPIPVEGRIEGAFMIRGPELHTCIKEGKRWFNRKWVKQILGGILDRYGYVISYALSWDMAAQRLAERTGFVRVGQIADLAIIYRLERKSCQP